MPNRRRLFSREVMQHITVPTLYHGTDQDMQRGQIIVPHERLPGGKSNYPALSHPDKAYASPDLDKAHNFAFTAAFTTPRPPRVYRVSALDEPQQDVNMPEGTAVTSRRGFRVRSEATSYTRPKRRVPPHPRLPGF